MRPPAKYADRIAVDPVYGCWLWTGKLDRDGYAMGREHRAVYELERGPIEPGMMLDHLCRRRRCVRPDHLEPVSNAINQLRATWRARAARKQCPAGHRLADRGMVTPEGGRICRLCQGPTR